MIVTVVYLILVSRSETPCSVQRFHLIPFQVFISRIGASALEALCNYRPVRFVVLECFNCLVWKVVLIY